MKLHSIIMRQFLFLIFLPALCWGMNRDLYLSIALKPDLYTREFFQWHAYWINPNGNPAIDFKQLPLPETFYRTIWELSESMRVYANLIPAHKSESLQNIFWALNRPSLNAEIFAQARQSLKDIAQSENKHQIIALAQDFDDKLAQLEANTPSIQILKKNDEAAIAEFQLIQKPVKPKQPDNPTYPNCLIS